MDVLAVDLSRHSLERYPGWIIDRNAIVGQLQPVLPVRAILVEQVRDGLVVPGELKKTEKQSKASSVKHLADRCHIRFDDRKEPPENVRRFISVSM
jgi:hypothetical protein